MEQLDRHILLLKSSRNLSEAKHAHKLIRRERSYNHDTYFANLIVETYARCRGIKDMLAAFHEISRPNCFSWNILLKGYTQNGYVDLARDVFESRMPEHDLVSFNTMLTAYVNDGALAAMELFESMPCTDSVSWTLVITALAKKGDMQKARGCFDQMPEKTLPAWNSMLIAYSHKGDIDQVLDLFNSVAARDQITWNALLVANAQLGDQLAADRVFEQMPQHDLVSWNSLLAAQLNLEGACRVFDSMPQHDAVCWTRLVLAHVRHGQIEAARRLVLEVMPEWTESVCNYCFPGLKSEDPADKMPMFSEASHASSSEILQLQRLPAAISALAKAGDLDSARRVFVKAGEATIATWNAMLSAYAHAGKVLQAKEFFDRMPGHDCVSWNIIMEAFCSCNDVEAVAVIFDQAPCKDVVAWNIMIKAFARSGYLDQSRRLFNEMPFRSIVSWVTMIQAYFDAAAFADGLILFRDMPDRQIASWNLLVTAFAEYGLHARAISTFQKAPEKGTISYNAVMACYNSSETLVSRAIEFIPEMTIQGFDPDKTTILLALVACGRRGLVDDSRKLFVSMLQDHGHVVGASCEHYYCMVDQLAKAGRLNEGEELLETMPFLPDAATWRALLGACCSIHPDENARLRFRAADGAFKGDPNSSAAYALMAKGRHLLKNSI